MGLLELVITVDSLVLGGLFEEAHAGVVLLGDFIELGGCGATGSEEVLLGESLHVLHVSVVEAFLGGAEAELLDCGESIGVVFLLLD